MPRGSLFVDPVPGNPPVGTTMQDARIALATLTGTAFMRAQGGGLTLSSTSLAVTVSSGVWVLPDISDARGAFLSPTAGASLTLTSGPATGTRIDSIFIKPNNYLNGDADSYVATQLVTGTASGTPAAPAAPGAGWQRYADIAVPTGAPTASACTATLYAATTFVPHMLRATTLAILTGIPGSQGQLASVYADSTAANNGLYQWTGSVWDQLETWASWTPFAGSAASPAYPSGFVSPGFGYPPAYKLVGGDTVQLSGILQKTGGGNFAVGDTFFNVPYPPAQTVYYLAEASAAAMVGMQIAPGTGAVTIHNLKGTSANWISLDGWSYRLR